MPRRSTALCAGAAMAFALDDNRITTEAMRMDLMGEVPVRFEPNAGCIRLASAVLPVPYCASGQQSQGGAISAADSRSDRTDGHVVILMLRFEHLECRWCMSQMPTAKSRRFFNISVSTSSVTVYRRFSHVDC